MEETISLLEPQCIFPQGESPDFKAEISGSKNIPHLEGQNPRPMVLKEKNSLSFAKTTFGGKYF